MIVIYDEKYVELVNTILIEKDDDHEFDLVIGSLEFLRTLNKDNKIIFVKSNSSLYENIMSLDEFDEDILTLTNDISFSKIMSTYYLCLPYDEETLLENIDEVVDSLKEIRDKFYNKAKSDDHKKDDIRDSSMIKDGKQFIFGVLALEESSLEDYIKPSFDTNNCMEIVLDLDSNLYELHVVTDYNFKNKELEIDYLRRLLKEFDKYLKDNKISKKFGEYLFLGSELKLDMKASTLSELYNNFKIFVEGYTQTYGKR